MNQQSISECLEQEKPDDITGQQDIQTLAETSRDNLEIPPTQIEESMLSLKPKNSLQLNRGQIISASLIILLAGVGIGRFDPNNASTPIETPISTQIKPLPVQTTQIQLAKTYQTLQNYTGEVVAMRTSEIGFERGGKLVTVMVDEGDRVTTETTLAQLDTTNLAAQRQSLVAQKAQAEARLTELKNGARSEQIAAAQATVRDLAKQLELEKLKSDRREYLYKEGAISQEQLDEVAFNSQALSERLSNARSNLAELVNGTRYEQIAAQQAAVDRLSAQIADLDITINKSTLKAPFSGTISQRYVDEGTVMNTGTSIFRLVEDSTPEVKIGVPINIAANLASGSQQEVEIGGKTYPAKVKTVLPEVDRATRTRTVILQLPSTAKVSPQEIARLPINQTIATEGYWLPITALVKSDRGLWSCYAVVATDNGDSKQVERRLVEVLETDGERVLVRGTLQEGDVIITDGTQRLVPSQLVTIE